MKRPRHMDDPTFNFVASDSRVARLLRQQRHYRERLRTNAKRKAAKRSRNRGT